MAETCGLCGHIFRRLELGIDVAERADSTTLSTLQYMDKAPTGVHICRPEVGCLDSSLSEPVQRVLRWLLPPTKPPTDSCNEQRSQTEQRQ